MAILVSSLSKECEHLMMKTQKKRKGAKLESRDGVDARSIHAKSKLQITE